MEFTLFLTISLEKNLKISFDYAIFTIVWTILKF